VDGVFRRRHREQADRPRRDSGLVQDEPEFDGDLDELEEGEGYYDDGPDEDTEAGLTEPETRSRGPGRHRAADSRHRAGDSRQPAGDYPQPAADYPDEGPGPWDGAGDFPQAERLDFGSLLVPVREGLDVQVNMAEDTGVWITVVRGDSALQLQAFAAPKTSGLWDEVRQEIAEELAKSGGDSQQVQGPFGAELQARVRAGAQGRRQPLEPVRFMGVDGPRWFLRGVISGPAASQPKLARPFEELFADVVVVRGDHPAPPRDLLEIRLPEEARRALADQLGQQAEGPAYPNPFERGPEITETR
jgi:hypothetical protein